MMKYFIAGFVIVFSALTLIDKKSNKEWLYANVFNYSIKHRIRRSIFNWL